MKIPVPYIRRAVRPWLVTGLVLSATGVSSLSGTTVGPLPVTHLCSARAMELQRITLQATAEARGASGIGVLIPAWSPTGVGITADGHLIYDIEITFSGLGQPGQTGHYVAWIAEPTLIKVFKLGEVTNTTLRFNDIALNKFIFLVTLENDAKIATRSGPIVLRGISPSGLLQSFVGHDLFTGGGPC